jgi:hypothetical protein
MVVGARGALAVTLLAAEAEHKVEPVLILRLPAAELPVRALLLKLVRGIHL